MQQPNILFLFPDQHRPDWLGCAGNGLPVRTPHIDRLAARGVRFTNAFTPSPLCSPARACLATGRDYQRCGVRNNDQNTPLSLPTYYRHLRDAGYEVAGVGKFDLHKPDHDWGLDGTKLLAEYGFTGGCDNEGKGDAIVTYRQNGMAPKGPYMHFLAAQGLAATHLAMYEPHLGKPGWMNFPAVTDLPDHAYCDNWLADNALRHLREFPAGKPWHLVVNFVGPHDPFDVTAEMRERWRTVEFPPPAGNSNPQAPDTIERRQNYAAMIENIDAHVGRMLAAIERRGELENTLIVYASDHGEMLGDHDRWGKSVWYTPSCGVPLIVAGPGVRSGVKSDALVALHDLAATFLDCAGAAPLPDSDARSLRPLLEGSTRSHRDWVTSALNDWSMVFDGRFKYVSGAGPQPLLYDVMEDPGEFRNLAHDQPQKVARLAALFQERLPR
jgi:arylsulfatase A-like enzyme